MSDPDRSLARKAAGGSRRALARLYERYRGRLLGYLVQVTGDRDVAEELYQEVWIKVMQGLDSYRPGRATFRAWLFRVAHNAAVDRLRRDALRHGPALDAPTGAGHEREIDRVSSPLPGPDRTGEGRLFADELSRALAALRDEQRTVVLLRHQQGLTYPEIAAALQIPEGTAKSLVHRGVTELRRRLHGWTPGDATR